MVSESQSGITLYDRLRVLSENLWWTWNPDVIRIFMDLDPHVWREVGHNPITILKQITPEEVEERASELVLHSRINHAYRRLHEYIRERHTWGGIHCGALWSHPVAYLSAEFGLHESLSIYSGGLGVLAGDHLKSASDLGVPLVAVGLLYNQGYFSQRLNRDGWQEEEYTDLVKDQLPLLPIQDADGKPLTIRIETRGRPLFARVWQVNVGRVRLFLLDSCIEQNAEEDRTLTSRLYGGDTRTRIRQELLLGVGGMRVLRAMNIQPRVIHLNEGHSAFAPLEEIRRVMEYDGITFDRARRRVSLQTVFTTHTPVPAGHDRFPPDLVEEHLGVFREKLGLSHKDFMAMGRVRPDDDGEPLCMTVLALKNSRRANAVSAIHGDISRRIWQVLWPNRREVEVPIGHITNGVHALSWLAPPMEQLYESHLGADWAQRMGHPDLWDKMESIEPMEIWETHQSLKMRLIRFVRRRLIAQAQRRNESEEKMKLCASALDPNILTIGFARRFATYKRADLIFSQPERLKKLVMDAKQPIQMLFAGKAHPRDDEGKKVLQRVASFCCKTEWNLRVVFIEDYDYNVARHLVQGVDVWLNNPQRPLEACGTSGQKIVLNGGLNLSVLDGWWGEAYDGYNGFAIGDGGMHQDPKVQFERDANSLYDVLEREVIPLYYQRDTAGIPVEWVQRIKWAVQSLGWRFTADRMIKDYAEKLYLPAACANSSDMIG